MFLLRPLRPLRRCTYERDLYQKSVKTAGTKRATSTQAADLDSPGPYDCLSRACQWRQVPRGTGASPREPVAKHGDKYYSALEIGITTIYKLPFPCEPIHLGMSTHM